MRPHAGKAQPILYDLVDEGRLPYLQFRARCVAYRKVLGCVPSASSSAGGRWTSPSVLKLLDPGGGAARSLP
jgi:hypothetical protein